MKAQILKMAGCKTEKEFYSKFPSEEAFMKVHGKTFKKAFLGENIKKLTSGINYSSIGESNGLPQSLGYNLSGDPNGTQFDLSGNTIKGQSLQQSISGPTETGGNDTMGKVTKGLGIAGKLIGSFQKLKAEKEQLKSADQMNQVSDLALEASQTRPEQISRRYVRPEDEELIPINSTGSGTNILGKDGLTLKKRKAAGGMNVDPYSMIGDKTSNIISEIGGENAGGEIGGTIGGTVGSIFGPAGKMIGQVGGQIIGGLIDRNPHKIKEFQAETARNDANMGFNNGIQGVQNQYSSYMEDGGTLNGDLKTGKGGYAQTVSYNPFLPDNGETVMFKGASHDDGGIDASYGNNPVEVERGEPAVKLEDGGGTDNMVVFGALPINKKYADVLGDPNAKNKNFKNYVADLSRTENKQNKTIETSTLKAGDVDMNTPFTKIELNSHKANILGANMKLKDIAEKKTRASMLQESINYIADKEGINAQEFAKGKVVKAKEGISLDKDKYPEPKQKFPWVEAINSVVPYFRPTDAEPLDPNQLAGERYALSNNQEEPVQAQTYHPQLDTPYDISYQDIRNDNQSDYNATQKMVGNNPAALALLNAQKYTANQKVGAEEFRANQAMKDKVYSGNRATLNDAQLKNLGIYDQQYSRQSQAKSNTKVVTQAALSSISDKQLKNKLENKTLQIYENMYNYRYDNKGRAVNMNPLAQFNIPTVGSAESNSNRNTGYNFGPGKEGEFDGEGRLIGIKPVTKTKNRNGAIVNAMKNL